MERWPLRCKSLISSCIASAVLACGDDGNGYGASEDPGTTEGGEEDAGEEIPMLNACSASDYVDRSGEDASRVITVGQTGLTFSPRCMLIAQGQSVVFEGSFSEHPLAPGNPRRPQAGSADTPIETTTSGSRVEFTFDEAGTFPYYCRVHAVGDGRGMAGSIHVQEDM